MGKKNTVSVEDRRPPPASYTEKETQTYTTTKREDSFLWKPSVFKYVDGRRVGIETASVFVELNRGVEFKPRAFCANFKGVGWERQKPAADDLIDFLESRADDRASHTCRWKDRRRPDVQRQLEERVDSLEQSEQEWEALFAEAVAQHPELASLRSPGKAVAA